MKINPNSKRDISRKGRLSDVKLKAKEETKESEDKKKAFRM